MFSTIWNLLRGSQSYIEKKRGSKGIEVTRRRKGGIKRRETDPTSNQFPKFSIARNTQGDSELGREEKRERGKRSDLVEKKESQKGKRAIKTVITLLSKNGF